MNLDAMCAEALTRLAALTEQRIAAFRAQAKRDAETTRRSFGQRMRWHTKQILREFGRG